MDCTIITTITTPERRAKQGVTVVEMMVALGVGGLVLGALATTFAFAGRSCAALANYTELDISSRNALDRMTKDIRQATRLISFSATNLSFETVNLATGATNTLAYVYNPAAGRLVRNYGGRSDLLLQQISSNSVKFSIFQRNPVGGPVDEYPTTDPNLCKVVQLYWVCSRSILGKAINTESVQSAKVVIRKE